MGRKILIAIVAVIIVIVLIPALVLFLYNRPTDKIKITPIEKSIKVYDTNTNKLMEMDLEEYLIGVIAQEMPASFETEALKAQAIAARTYAYKRILEPDNRVKQIHPEADIVTNPNISQAWISDAEMREKWGMWDYRKYRKKIEDAVIATKGLVLVYENKLIDPVYHASCGGGKTENSDEVWLYRFPYLVSVQCPLHQDRHFQDTKIIPIRNLDVALGTKLEAIPVARLQGNNDYIKVLERTGAGRIKSISIGGQTFLATELRTKLGLKSTWFTWEINQEGITFTTRGFGHGVGMCQYGANHLAIEGKTYSQILKHYYTGVELIQAY